MSTINRITIPLIAIIIAISSAIGQTKLLAKGNDEYCNARFKYCIWYPRTMKAGPEAQNGDGRIFKEGEASITVYGSGNWNADGDVVSLKKKYTEDIREQKGCKITYSKLGNTFYVLSGIKDGHIFYQKTMQLTNAFGTAILEYRPADSNRYKKLTSLILQGFRRDTD